VGPMVQQRPADSRSGPALRRRARSRIRRAGRWVTAAPILALLAVLALLAGGCGGSSDTKANEAYANSVCTAIGSWEQQIKSIATSLGGAVSKASLESSVTQAEAATKTLVGQIKAVKPPDTSQGQAAKQQLDQLTTDINDTVNAAKTALTQVQANASAAAISAIVATFAPQVQSLMSETKSAISTLKSAGGALASAFKSTDSCKSLGGS
jgi:hypothetical protein